jgi:hypothetical protein
MPFSQMKLVDQIQFGPFSTHYHANLVDADFKTALSAFLDSKLLPQLDEPTDDADGMLVATFDSDRYCGPNSLVKNIFTLEMTLLGPDGNSELKTDIEFHPNTKTFSPRAGYGHHFYVWTPRRKRDRETELELIQRLADDFQRTHRVGLKCPICHGNVTGVDDPTIFDIRCTEQRCFVYNYHKDENGRLAHGHFVTKHPELRA